MAKVHRPVTNLFPSYGRKGGHVFRTGCGVTLNVHVPDRDVLTGMAFQRLLDEWRSASADRRCRRCQAYKGGWRGLL